MDVLSRRGSPSGPGLLRRLAVAVPGVILAAFFAFVGWHKAFASQADLELHHAWTAYVPWWIGRPWGWVELAGAVALLAGAVTPRAWPWTWPFAAILAASQTWSSVIHLQHGQTDALPQNLILFVVLVLIAVITRAAQRKEIEA